MNIYAFSGISFSNRFLFGLTSFFTPLTDCDIVAQAVEEACPDDNEGEVSLLHQYESLT